ncbi:DUF2500 family protein [Paenibacillus campi]|uniref:DUF2500 family protein n=1 Tax=Paenibacillus campi TaxID=3106031 RepID=UPI002AFDE252|nr:DUF2500 family protein [Paenibacillus sp. SGZ-1014]
MDGTHIFIMAPIAIIGLALLLAGLADAQQKRKDDRQPVIEQISKIVDKRPMQTSETTNKFYVTIELENQQRFEIEVSSDQYGLIVVGDHVKYITQGSRKKVERMM